MSANDSRDIKVLLDQALQAHGSGDLSRAEQSYRQILSVDPAHPEALHYLGVIGLQVGRFEEAAELIGKSVKARPDYVDALSNLGNALQSLGRHGEAITHYDHVLTLNPQSATVLANLGNALTNIGELDRAVESYGKALALEPRLVDARRSLADTLLVLGRPAEALGHIKLATTSDPAVQVSTGNILAALGKYKEAIACFTQVLNVHPHLAPVLCNLGNVLRQNARLTDAITQYQKALTIDPNYVEGHYNLGIAFQDNGEKEQALGELRKALKLDPYCTKAWRSIADLSTQTIDSVDFDAIKKAQKISDYSPEQLSHLEFALGKCFEDIGRYETAIEHYHKGNELRRNQFRYSPDDEVVVFENLKKTFGSDFFRHWSGVGIDDELPIFIVGMPRSGTTLAEQILASHPMVFGGGELQFLPLSIVEEFPMAGGVDYTGSLVDATETQFESVGKRYLNQLRELNPDARFITDKLPNNFLNVGMIKLLFPKATIIHCVRDARDTCYSIYKNYFDAHGHFYAYEMRELAGYHRLYRDLMIHWNETLRGSLYKLQYESLVHDQEATTRRLLDACGLPWDPACLEFHKTDRQVSTISASQVRQPMYKGSVGAWRNVAESLSPMIEILERQ